MDGQRTKTFCCPRHTADLVRSLVRLVQRIFEQLTLFRCRHDFDFRNKFHTIIIAHMFFLANPRPLFKNMEEAFFHCLRQWFPRLILMKALILSGGKGSRLYPLTYTNAKQLIPVANKPVLFRVIEAIRDAGITDIGIVIGSEENGRRDGSCGTGQTVGRRHHLHCAGCPFGPGPLRLIAQDFLGDDRFVMFLGDNVIEGGISNPISQFRGFRIITARSY